LHPKSIPSVLSRRELLPAANANADATDGDVPTTAGRYVPTTAHASQPRTGCGDPGISFTQARGDDLLLIVCLL
jgi:hypothetical protein